MIKYWQSKKNFLPTRCLAFGVVLSFLFTTLSAPFAQANLWDERNEAIKNLKENAKRKEPIQLASAKLGGMGAVKDSFLPGRLGADVAEIESALLEGKGQKNTVSKDLIKEALRKRQIRTARSGGNLKGVPQALWESVAAFGNIQKVHLAKGQELKWADGRITAKTPFVVHLQDVHDVYGVQRNLSFLISELMRSGAGIVGLEGSVGRLEGLETWRRYPDREGLLEVAGYLAKGGLLTGAELAGLGRNEGSVEFYGLEEKETYLDQVESFQETLAKKDDMKKWSAGIEPILARLKEKAYSPEQKELDAGRARFDAQKETLGQRVEFLTQDKFSVFPAERNRYPNVGKFLKTYALEKSMDFKKISGEQKKLLAGLSKKLSQSELLALLEDSVLYRLGRIGYADFYSSLKERCLRAGVAMTPEVSKYIEYVSAVEGISQEGLFDELARLEEQAWSRSFTSPVSIQSAVHELDVDYALAKKGLDFAMSPQDYEKYDARKERIANINSRVREASALLNDDALSIKEELGQDLLQKVGRFNQLSHQRNRVFVQKLAQKMQENGKNFSVIVAGGYHTGGIEELLKSENISFVTIRPKIDLAEMKDGHHPLQAFLRDPLALEKLFAQEKVTIVRAHALDGLSAAFDSGARAARSVRGLLSVLAPVVGLSRLSETDAASFRNQLEAFINSNGLDSVAIRNARTQGGLFLADVGFGGSNYVVSLAAADDSFAQKLIEHPENLLDQLEILESAPETIVSGRTVSLAGNRETAFAVAEYRSNFAVRLWNGAKNWIGSGAKPKLISSVAAGILIGSFVSPLIYGGAENFSQYFNLALFNAVYFTQLIGLSALGSMVIIQWYINQFYPQMRFALPSGGKFGKVPSIAGADRPGIFFRSNDSGGSASAGREVASDRPNKLVYYFGDGVAEGVSEIESAADRRRILGGKGMGLQEMLSWGIPVPPGFTIPTQVGISYLRNRSYPEGLEASVQDSIRRLEQSTGKIFGGTENPLLVSVRSGGPVSMPGMMDTVLNLGLNDETVEGLAAVTNNRRFAMDSYRRLIEAYGSVVMGVDKSKFSETLAEIKNDIGVRDDGNIPADVLENRVIPAFKQLVLSETGRAFPTDANDQLWGAILAVFDSWDGDRAKVYRADARKRGENITEDMGTAVNVVSMVFGNTGNDSGTGVYFTRDSSNGEPKAYGEYLANAQGEDVVSGRFTTTPIATLEELMPELYNELLEVGAELEKRYKNMMDIEFTIENGKLYILQSRTGKRTGPAAIKIAVDMAKEGLITKQEALLMVKPDEIIQTLSKQIDPSAKIESERVLTQGAASSFGAAWGRVVFSPELAVELAEEGFNVILVRNETEPSDVAGMYASKGVLTARGGGTSHAMIVAKSRGIPAVVGAASLIINEKEKTLQVGDTLIYEGDIITLDASGNRVILGNVDLIDGKMTPELEELLNWADEFRSLKIRANLDTGEEAVEARKLGAEGVGLVRTEHMFFGEERLPVMQKMILAETPEARQEALDQLYAFQLQDFESIFQAMAGYPVTVRFLDPPLHEFLPKTPEQVEELSQKIGVSAERIGAMVEDLREQNPMLGLRGARLGIIYPEVTSMQARAIMQAAVNVAKREHRAIYPEMMVPLVFSRAEFENQKAVIESAAREVLVQAGISKDMIPYHIGTMIELPGAAIHAADLAQSAEFFSFGTNDLTQTTLGLSRDDSGKFLPAYQSDELKLLESDPFVTLHQAVADMMRIGIEGGRSVNELLKIGICGEHGRDPASIEISHALGLNYVSPSSLGVPVARLVAAQAQIKNPRQSVELGIPSIAVEGTYVRRETTFNAGPSEGYAEEPMHDAVVMAAVGVVAGGHRGNVLGLTDKAEIGRRKIIADGLAKRIVQGVLFARGIRTIFHASEGFGRDGVDDSFRGGEIVNPDGTRGERHAIIDVIEGTNDTSSNNDGLPRGEIGRSRSGGTSVVVHGSGVESLGNAPDVYADQLFSRVPAEREALAQAMATRYLKSENREEILAVLKTIADANGISVNDMEVVILNRKRESRRLNSLQTIQRMDYPGLEITQIEDGTVPHGLLASMGVKPGMGKHKVVWTVGGSAEAFMNLAVAGSIPGAVGAVSLYTKGINKKSDGTDAQNLDRKYQFDDKEKAEIQKGRPGDYQEILRGKVFAIGDVKGSVEGHFSFITDNGVFNMPGVREISPGVFRVHTLHIAGGAGSIRIDDVPQEAFDDVFKAYGRSLNAAADVAELLDGIKDSIAVGSDGVAIADEKAFRTQTVHFLERQASLNPNADVKAAAQRILREAGIALGAYEASIHNFYLARSRGEWGDMTMPAYNIRVNTFETASDIFRAAMADDAVAPTFELAASEIRYTDQTPAEFVSMIYAAAIATGYKGPLFIQADHYQTNKSNYDKDPEAAMAAVEKMIEAAVAAGKMNIDVDPSTLINNAVLTEIVRLQQEFVDRYIERRSQTDAEFAELVSTLAQPGNENGLRSLRRKLVDDMEVWALSLFESAEFFKSLQPYTDLFTQQERNALLNQFGLTEDEFKQMRELYRQAHETTVAASMRYIRFIRGLEKKYGITEPISIGVEERHIDTPEHRENPSTVLGSITLMGQIISQSRAEGLVPPSKLALQTGTMHGLGGRVEWGIYVRHMLARLAIGVAVFVQHGTSTLDKPDFFELPGSGSGEAHLATEYQKISFEGVAMAEGEEIYALKKDMIAYLVALIRPELADIDPKIVAKLESANLLDRAKRENDYEKKYRARWDEAFKVLGAQGLSVAQIETAILGDTEALGQFRGDFKDLVKELSGPFKFELRNLPPQVQAAIDRTLSDEFHRLNIALNFAGSRALLEQGVMGVTPDHVALPPRPEALQLAASPALPTFVLPATRENFKSWFDWTGNIGLFLYASIREYRHWVKATFNHSYRIEYFDMHNFDTKFDPNSFKGRVPFILTFQMYFVPILNIIYYVTTGHNLPWLFQSNDLSVVIAAVLLVLITPIFVHFSWDLFAAIINRIVKDFLPVFILPRQSDMSGGDQQVPVVWNGKTIRTIESVNPADIKGKTVLVRVDYNVKYPLSAANDMRIRETVPLIQQLKAMGAAKIVLMSHLQPGDKVAPNDTLERAAAHLSGLIGETVISGPGYQDDWAANLKSAVSNMPSNGSVMLMENLRLHPGETKNNPDFSKAIIDAVNPGLFVQEAFGTLHREHASMTGIPELLGLDGVQSVAGILVAKEMQMLSQALENPERPVAVILGGAKLAGTQTEPGKIDVIRHILPRLQEGDTLVIGGAMAYTFIVANFIKWKMDTEGAANVNPEESAKLLVGNSRFELDKVNEALDVLINAQDKGVEVIIPFDHIASNLAPEKGRFPDETRFMIFTTPGGIPEGWMGVDIGPATSLHVQSSLKKARTILGNGPVGVFEASRTFEGTKALVEALFNANKDGALVVVGGGETLAAIEKARRNGLEGEVTHASTGGGVFLNLVAGKDVPGLRSLYETRTGFASAFGFASFTLAGYGAVDYQNGFESLLAMSILAVMTMGLTVLYRFQNSALQWRLAVPGLRPTFNSVAVLPDASDASENSGPSIVVIPSPDGTGNGNRNGAGGYGKGGDNRGDGDNGQMPSDPVDAFINGLREIKVVDELFARIPVGQELLDQIISGTVSADKRKQSRLEMFLKALGEYEYLYQKSREPDAPEGLKLKMRNWETELEKYGYGGGSMWKGGIELGSDYAKYLSPESVQPGTVYMGGGLFAVADIAAAIMSFFTGRDRSAYLNEGNLNTAEIWTDVQRLAARWVSKIVKPSVTAYAGNGDEVRQPEGQGLFEVVAQGFSRQVGAYTTAVNLPGILEAGARGTIIAHSETRYGRAESLEINGNGESVVKGSVRRGDTDKEINNKLRAAFNAGLETIILCVGEPLSARHSKQHEEFVQRQIQKDLKGLTPEQVANLVIAYEPIWAIGTKMTPTPYEIESMHRVIRDEIKLMYGPEVARTVKVLYGGSVTPANASEILSTDGVDGALVGGASVSAESFTAIAQIAEGLSQNGAGKKIIVANWKAYASKAYALEEEDVKRDAPEAFVDALKAAGLKHARVIIAPPFPLLDRLVNLANSASEFFAPPTPADVEDMSLIDANNALDEAAESLVPVPGNVYSDIGFEGTNQRLGWVIPPDPHTIMDYVRQIDGMLEGMENVIFIGMGGSINSVKAYAGIKGQGSINVDALDSLDPAALAKVLKGKDLSKTLVVTISKSATTAETLGLTDIFQLAFGDEWKKHILILTDPENVGKLPINYRGVTTMPIQVDGGNNIGGRFTAPFTGTWLLPAHMFSGLNLGFGWEELLGEFKRVAFDAMDSARIMNEAGADRFAVVVENGRVRDAMNTWIIQLIQESLGSKIDGFNPKTIVAARGDAVPEGFEELLILNDPTLNLDVNAVLLQYGLERFVAELARLKGINFVTQPGVEDYKNETRRLQASSVELTDPEEIDVDGLIRAINARWNADPKDFVEVVIYGDFEPEAVKALERRIQAELPLGVLAQVFIGSDWNHHSYQAAKDDPNTLFVILQKSKYEIPKGRIFKDSKDKLLGNIETLKLIAHATYNTLTSKALFYSIDANAVEALADDLVSTGVESPASEGVANRGLIVSAKILGSRWLAGVASAARAVIGFAQPEITAHAAFDGTGSAIRGLMPRIQLDYYRETGVVAKYEISNQTPRPWLMDHQQARGIGLVNGEVVRKYSIVVEGLSDASVARLHRIRRAADNGWGPRVIRDSISALNPVMAVAYEDADYTKVISEQMTSLSDRERAALAVHLADMLYILNEPDNRNPYNNYRFIHEIAFTGAASRQPLLFAGRGIGIRPILPDWSGPLDIPQADLDQMIANEIEFVIDRILLGASFANMEVPGTRKFELVREDLERKRALSVRFVVDFLEEFKTLPALQRDDAEIEIYNNAIAGVLAKHKGEPLVDEVAAEFELRKSGITYMSGGLFAVADIAAAFMSFITGRDRSVYSKDGSLNTAEIRTVIGQGLRKAQRAFAMGRESATEEIQAIRSAALSPEVKSAVRRDFLLHTGEVMTGYDLSPISEESHWVIVTARSANTWKNYKVKVNGSVDRDESERTAYLAEKGWGSRVLYPAAIENGRPAVTVSEFFDVHDSLAYLLPHLSDDRIDSITRSFAEMLYAMNRGVDPSDPRITPPVHPLAFGPLDNGVNLFIDRKGITPRSILVNWDGGNGRDASLTEKISNEVRFILNEIIMPVSNPEMLALRKPLLRPDDTHEDAASKSVRFAAKTLDALRNLAREGGELEVYDAVISDVLGRYQENYLIDQLRNALSRKSVKPVLTLPEAGDAVGIPLYTPTDTLNVRPRVIVGPETFGSDVPAKFQIAFAGFSADRRNNGYRNTAEANQAVNAQLKQAFATGVETVVLVVGETQSDRHYGKELLVIRDQISSALAGLTAEEVSRLTIVYEPVWSMETGWGILPAQIKRTHDSILNLVSTLYDQSTADSVKVLYGGSIDAKSAREILSHDNVDGLFVNGENISGAATLAADAVEDISLKRREGGRTVLVKVDDRKYSYEVRNLVDSLHKSGLLQTKVLISVPHRLFPDLVRSVNDAFVPFERMVEAGDAGIPGDLLSNEAALTSHNWPGIAPNIESDLLKDFVDVTGDELKTWVARPISVPIGEAIRVELHGKSTIKSYLIRSIPVDAVSPVRFLHRVRFAAEKEWGPRVVFDHVSAKDGRLTLVTRRIDAGKNVPASIASLTEEERRTLALKFGEMLYIMNEFTAGSGSHKVAHDIAYGSFEGHPLMFDGRGIDIHPVFEFWDGIALLQEAPPVGTMIANGVEYVLNQMLLRDIFQGSSQSPWTQNDIERRKRYSVEFVADSLATMREQAVTPQKREIYEGAISEALKRHEGNPLVDQVAEILSREATPRQEFVNVGAAEAITFPLSFVTGRKYLKDGSPDWPLVKSDALGLIREFPVLSALVPGALLLGGIAAWFLGAPAIGLLGLAVSTASLIVLRQQAAEPTSPWIEKSERLRSAAMELRGGNAGSVQTFLAEAAEDLRNASGFNSGSVQDALAAGTISGLLLALRGAQDTDATDAVRSATEKFFSIETDDGIFTPTRILDHLDARALRFTLNKSDSKITARLKRLVGAASTPELAAAFEEGAVRGFGAAAHATLPEKDRYGAEVQVPTIGKSGTLMIDVSQPSELEAGKVLAALKELADGADKAGKHLVLVANTQAALDKMMELNGMADAVKGGTARLVLDRDSFGRMRIDSIAAQIPASWRQNITLLTRNEARFVDSFTLQITILRLISDAAAVEVRTLKSITDEIRKLAIVKIQA